MKSSHSTVIRFAESDRCFADFVPCNEFADFGFFEEELENDQAARCIFDALNGNQCPFSPDELFEACLNGERPVERGPGCAELCTAQDLCGVLPRDKTSSAATGHAMITCV